MTTVLVAYAGVTAALGALLLVVMVVQGVMATVRMRRAAGADPAGTVDVVETRARQPERVGCG
ncbi:MAG: hypothetical protein JWN88_772 [Frankiales bacterium]|jgi:hypothetical protein|nr:hypothetical protein [Frankiales bacterium]